MNFRGLHRRLLDHVRERVRNGDVTERALARAIGISQPHLHNSLKGIRSLSPEIADRLLSHLRISVLDLLEPHEREAYLEVVGIPAEVSSGETTRTRIRDGRDLVYVPVLETPVGPGRPWPVGIHQHERFPIPQAMLQNIAEPVVARLMSDPELQDAVVAGQMSLLDQSSHARRNLAENEWYAVALPGGIVIRRLVYREGALRLAGSQLLESRELQRLPLDEGSLMEVVKARVALLDAARTLREAGYYRCPRLLPISR